MLITLVLFLSHIAKIRYWRSWWQKYKANWCKQQRLQGKLTPSNQKIRDRACEQSRKHLDNNCFAPATIHRIKLTTLYLSQKTLIGEARPPVFPDVMRYPPWGGIREGPMETKDLYAQWAIKSYSSSWETVEPHGNSGLSPLPTCNKAPSNLLTWVVLEEAY